MCAINVPITGIDGILNGLRYFTGWRLKNTEFRIVTFSLSISIGTNFLLTILYIQLVLGQKDFFLIFKLLFKGASGLFLKIGAKQILKSLTQSKEIFSEVIQTKFAIFMTLTKYVIVLSLRSCFFTKVQIFYLNCPMYDNHSNFSKKNICRCVFWAWILN